MELVTLFIDGTEVKVPKGTNLIEAAKQLGVEIPHYCYHPHLSIAGNCRMCQVQVEGQPKLTIACNTGAAEGMKVRTHLSDPAVAEAQRATLEFILLNHPLDCTVCDQAGHCKLQDYYYDYNTKPARSLEEKVHKVKAERLGPHVMYDGERCIVCTRCTRFCEEVPGTSELGVFNRGDHSVIGAYPGRELDNPFSGTVVDLCPVGALTHSDWRFNTRIWYTEATESICPGCSTGCNVKVHTRDDQVVQVKARLNPDVNKEWLCDEGRYGFNRFQPTARLTAPMERGKDSFERRSLKELEPRLKLLAGSSPEDAAVFISPFVTLEEMAVAVAFAEGVMGVPANSGALSVRVVRRELTPVEAILISPDRAPNIRAAELLGVVAPEHWREELERRYEALIGKVKSGQVKRLISIGDFSISDSDVDEELFKALRSATISVAITPRDALEVTGSAKTGAFNNRAHLAHSVILPGRTVNERAGLFVNKDRRVQRISALLQTPFGVYPEWQLLNMLAKVCGKSLVPQQNLNESGLFSWVTTKFSALSGLASLQG
jgi:NADH-quinone oxidoreductase subunit G